MRTQYASFRRSSRGFTLMELLLVLGIIAMLIGGGTLAYRGITENARETNTQKKVMLLDSMIQQYQMKNTGRTPPDLKSLKAVGLVTTDDTLIDDWGQEIQYKRNGQKNPTGYDIYSSGRDKQVDTADDIGNWNTGG